LERPGFTPGFSAARGGAGLAANHNSLAANSKIGQPHALKSDGLDGNGAV
jgi:hypothetical protein